MGAGLGAEPATPVKCMAQSACSPPLACGEKPCAVKPQITVTIAKAAMIASRR